MVLLNYYIQIKNQLEKVLVDRGKPSVSVSFYSDTVFTAPEAVRFPLLLFKYDRVDWQTSAEREYKASVSFCVYVVMEPEAQHDYTEALQIASMVDRAILLTPSSLSNENEVVTAGSIHKCCEKQCTVDEYPWEKNQYFIWEITYETTLIERALKKNYTLLTNGVFTKQELDDPDRRLAIENQLAQKGIVLEDYLSEGADQHRATIEKNVEPIIESQRGTTTSQ
ncbi:MAG: hypothetical protein AAF551_05405 [Bacteroidota bacterium]